MRRFHNPMTIFMLIILSIMLMLITCFFILVDNIPQIIYLIIPSFFLVIVLITIWGEYKFRKSDAKMSKENGEDNNTAENVAEIVKRGPKKVVFLTIIITLAVIGGFVALFMYNTLLGITLFIVFCLVLLLYPLYKSKKITTVEKYISSKKGNIRHLLQMIHEQILEVAPSIIPIIDSTFLFPTYVYVKNKEQSEIYKLISVQAIIGGKSICVYPSNPEVFSVFAERLKDYKNNGYSELYIPTGNTFDYNLIKDIVKFNMERIELVSDKGC